MFGPTNKIIYEVLPSCHPLGPLDPQTWLRNNRGLILLRPISYLPKSPAVFICPEITAEDAGSGFRMQRFG
jgi:hypothetical protein